MGKLPFASKHILVSGLVLFTFLMGTAKTRATSANAVEESAQTFTNSIGMKFVFIKPGKFTMGSPVNEPGRDGDETQFQVILAQGFYMQNTEVTQGQWKAVMGKNPAHFKQCGENCPMEMISWDECQAFIKKLNEKEGTDKYRLPTEAQWEYACRAGTTTRFSFGDCLTTDAANYNGTLSFEGCNAGQKRGQTPQPPQTMPVASFKPNAWGLYDMHGNVAEWCQDWYDSYYPQGPIQDPTGSTAGPLRVIRGGDWHDDAKLCRSANRHYYMPAEWHNRLGLRLVRAK